MFLRNGFFRQNAKISRGRKYCHEEADGKDAECFDATEFVNQVHNV